jgi:hypothetical protein
MVSSSSGTHLASLLHVNPSPDSTKPWPAGGAMPPQTLATKVESLERRMANLETLPDRMDRLESQIVQLRTEMREEFSAIRGEVNGFRDETRGEFEAVRAEIRVAAATLREEIRAGDEESRHFMRVLHEEVIGRLALIQEGRSSRRGGGKRGGR